MGKREAIFYIGRINKIGFSQDDFLNILFDTKPYNDGNSVWNIVNLTKNESNGVVYFFGKLNKAKPDAIVKVMSEDYKREIEKEEPDLVMASSEFVYIPDHSGIAFHSIPNYIEPKKFKSIFCKIIENSLDNFFVDCQINLIDDLDSFFKKLNTFDSINKMKAVVNPPNPLFGKFWESLKNYLNNRKADELFVQESNKKSSLNTKIKELIEILLRGDKNEIEKYLKDNEISILDLAILMSLDGYGNGRIDGRSNGQYAFIKTHEKIMHFGLARDFTDSEIFEKAITIFRRITDERHMEH